MPRGPGDPVGPGGPLTPGEPSGLKLGRPGSPLSPLGPVDPGKPGKPGPPEERQIFTASTIAWNKRDLKSCQHV